MSVRKILVPLSGTSSDGEVLATALSVTRDFGAQLVGLFSRPDPADALPYLGDGVSGQVIEDLLTAAKQGADRAAAQALAGLKEAAKKIGLPVVDKGDFTLPSARFLDVTGRRDEVVARHSRLADLIIFGDTDEFGGAGGTALEAAMMSGGRPVLIAPRKSWEPVGGSVAIGWDRSVEAAHAVTGALPFLAKAKSVTVICVGEGDHEPVSGEFLSDYLKLHGVDVEIRKIERKDRAVGEILLAEAEAAKVDLLVMGGYGHSRLREFFMGGATQHIRAHATLPVLMAH